MAVCLFAYGTLQDERCMAALLGGRKWRVLGAGTVAGELYDAGDYPALRVGAQGQVPGVLIALEDDAALAVLDDYEGVEVGLYVRRECTVRREDGRAASAWVYVYNRSVAGLRRIDRWPPGNG